MELKIRKFVTYVEDVLADGGREANIPLKMFAVAAVMENPWAARGYVENLKPEIRELGPRLGKQLSDRILELAGGGEAVEAYGKAGVVGTMGELEHASALIHTLSFGNIYRNAVGAETYLAFTNTRGGPNAPISIPLMHKHDAGKRSHYLTAQFSINDAPAPDELVVGLGASIGGRPHHRIGDRYQDMRELGDG